MARIYADRVMETTTSTGTGNITLAGALVGFRAFSDVATTGDIFDYAIFAVDADGAPTGQWETGRGTYSAANTLTRTTFQASSTGSAVSFSAGTKYAILSENGASLSGGSSAYDAPPTKPAASDFIQLNFAGTTTVVDGSSSVILKETAISTTTVRAIVRTAPTAPFSLYSRIDFSKRLQSGTAGGIILRNSSNGKVVIIGTSGSISFVCTNWNSLTSFSGSVFQLNLTGRFPVWYRVDVTSTGYSIFTSPDGYDYDSALSTQTLASFIGAIDQVGYCVIAAQSPAATYVYSDSFTAPS